MVKRGISLETLDAKIDALAREIKRVDGDQRKNGILLERIEGKFGLLYEGYFAHDARAARLEDKMGNIEERMDLIEEHMGSIEKRMGSLETKMDEGFNFIIEKLDQKMDKVLRPA